MSLSQLSFINAALIKLGAYKMTALGDSSTEADIAGTLYAPVRDTLLSLYPWSFATRQVALSTPDTAPLADYAYGFALPGDHLRTLSVGHNGQGAGVHYRQVGGRIETDTIPVTLTYIARVSETLQPAYFDVVLINRLAADMCVPLTENTARAESLYRIAEQELARARRVDSQQETPLTIRRFILTDVRRA